MLPALNIPTLVSPLCLSLSHTFHTATAKQRHERYYLPLGFVLQYLSLHRFPSPSRSIPIPVLGSLPFPSHFLIALHVLLTLAIVSVIAIARTATSTAWRSGIRPVLIIIIFVGYLIPIQWSNGEEVAWRVLLAAWWLNLCPEIIATIPRETLAGAFRLF